MLLLAFAVGVAVMGKARSLEAKLARLKQLRDVPHSADVVRELRAGLGDASGFVVAQAAELVTEANGAELTANLLAAFDRLMVDPVKRDKLCKGKIAIAEALNRIEYPKIDLFLRAVRYVQMEPVWGGQQDSAGPLRAACGFGIVRLDRLCAPLLLVDLLADPERPVRVAAAQALAHCVASTALPLLRLKARLGDTEPEVTSECFSSLLQMGAADAVPFIVEFLEARDDGVRGAALLALGESRQPEAFDHLVRFWKRPLRDLCDETLLAFALLRLPAATDFLLSLIGESPDVSAAAVAALAVLRHDSQVKQRTEEAVQRAGGPALRKLFEEKFRE